VSWVAKRLVTWTSQTLPVLPIQNIWER